MNWLEHTTWKDLALRDIDLTDRAYFIPCWSGSDRLIESVSRTGIINAPVVQAGRAGPYIPVLGRRRLQAAAATNRSVATVRVVPQEMPQTDGYLLAFRDNVSHRSFGQAARAVIVRRFLELLPRDALTDEILPALGIPPKGPKLQRLTRVGSLPDHMLEALETGRIKEKTALLFADMEPADRNALFETAQRLALNANKTAELVEVLHDLSIFYGISIMELIRQAVGQINSQKTELCGPEDARSLRRFLKHLKHPELADLEREVTRWIEELNLPGSVRIAAHSSFEDERCTLEIDVESRAAAEAVLEKIGLRERT